MKTPQWCSILLVVINVIGLFTPGVPGLVIVFAVLLVSIFMLLLFFHPRR